MSNQRYDHSRRTLIWARSFFLTLVWASSLSVNALAADYSFAVLPQRSPLLTAQYWNPILDYVSRTSGVSLELKVARTAPEFNAAAAASSYDFVYSNTIFQPSMAEARYHVILRPTNEKISGQIITLETSPLHSLRDLDGKEVGFPSLAAFVGYAVPSAYLQQEHITVIPVFGGNQEGIMGQLKAGKVMAAGVNSQVMKAFAAREHLSYRVLWESPPFYNIPIAAHPRVPALAVQSVQRAFEKMGDDPTGKEILDKSNALIGLDPFYYLPANQADYQSYINFYQMAQDHPVSGHPQDGK